MKKEESRTKNWAFQDAEIYIFDFCLRLLLWVFNCYCSVSKLCPTFCDPMDGSMPCFPMLYHLQKFAQSHVHWVSDAIEPSHPLPPPSPPALNLSQRQYSCLGNPGTEEPRRLQLLALQESDRTEQLSLSFFFRCPRSLKWKSDNLFYPLSRSFTQAWCYDIIYKILVNWPM